MSDIDLLRLGQLLNARDLSKEQKLDLANKINIHYSIPNGTYKMLQEESYIGYTCLHFAALNFDWDFTDELLKRGADLFRQGMQDQKTPLHVAVDSIRNCKDRRIWEISGKLQSCQVISTLLSAHVTSSNSSNPKCNNGISHLHIACMYNCTKTIEYFLKSGQSVNQVTNSDAHWPLYIPLHFAVRYSCVEAVQCLINNGADMFAKDAEGLSPFNLSVERLLRVNDYFTMSERTICIPYEDEIKRLEAIVSIFMGYASASGIEVLDDMGLTIFHIACIFKDTSIVTQLLKGNNDLDSQVSFDSKCWPGWTPLHIAACSSIETVKLLVQHGSDMFKKNAKGETPLDMCFKRYSPSTLHSILSTKAEFRSILLADESTTLMDLLLAMNDLESFSMYLHSLENPNVCVSSTSPIFPGYSILHLVTAMNDRRESWIDFLFETDSLENLDSLPKVYNCTADESRLCWDIIDECLSSGCSVTIKNADHQTPIHLAFRSQCLPITLIKMLGACHQDAVDSDDLSVLHIACATCNLQTVESLIHARAKVNRAAKSSFQWYYCYLTRKFGFPAINVDSTPLHVAIAYGYPGVMDYLLDRGADVYAQDAEGFTPAHLSMAHSRGSNGIACAIFNKIEVTRDCTSKQGLAHLQVAAFAGNARALRKSALDGANVNAEVPESLARFAGKTPLELAMQVEREVRGDLTVEALIDLGADIYADGVLRCLMSEIDRNYVEHFANRLKLRENVNEAIDPSSGLTLLHVACGSLDENWVEQLLRRGAEVNSRIRDDEDYAGPWRGYTPLHALVLVYRMRFPGSTVDLSIPESTIDLKARRLISELLRRKANVMIGSDDGTPLHMAHGWLRISNIQVPVGDDDAFVTMIRERFRVVYVLWMPVGEMFKRQESCNANPTDSNGVSHFHLASLHGNTKEIVERFLDSGVDINHPSCPLSDGFPGYTALHFAIFNLSVDTTRLLLERGANVNAEDRDGNTPLHLAVARSTVYNELIELCVRHGAKFDAINVRGQTPADILLTLGGFTYEQLQCLMSKGSTISSKGIAFDFESARLIMENARPADRLKIFELFLKVYNKQRKNGCNLVHAIVKARKTYNSLRFFKVEDYLQVMQLLVNEGCDVDQQDESGDTPLSTARRLKNKPAIQALIRIGADVNNMTKSIDWSVYELTFPDDLLDHFLVLHLHKMKILGLHMSATTGKMLANFEKQNAISVDVESEMKKAKSFEITKPITASAFLSEIGAVVWYSRMLPDKRQIIDIFFKNITLLNMEFPKLAELMILQYRKAVVRSELIDHAKEVLALECNMDFPDPCLEGILDYFQNNELNYLIEHSEAMGNFHKRQKVK